MSWTVLFLSEAEKDLEKLAGNQKLLVFKAIQKVKNNPLPDTEGGYGKALGNQGKRNLTGFYKIKIKDAGIRIVYKLIRTESEMIIIVIGARADNVVYDLATRRIVKHGLDS